MRCDCRAHLHDIEEDFLPQAVLALEELMLGVGAGNVSADELLTGGRHLQQLRVLVFHRHVGGVAQQLPHDGPEMMRDALSDQLLDGLKSERANKKERVSERETLKRINTLLLCVLRDVVLSIS